VHKLHDNSRFICHISLGPRKIRRLEKRRQFSPNVAKK
jgi:hypothetical protein